MFKPDRPIWCRGHHPSRCCCAGRERVEAYMVDHSTYVSDLLKTDVDEGHDWDIFDNNEAAGLDLLEGDIQHDETFNRNSIIGDKYRWPATIPYYLEDSLDMNAKGVILKAFDQYRLKTCIDFTPWKGEKNYISVFKGSKEHNFRTYDDTVSSALGVPYDYSSVMHYNKTSFSIGSEPTIVTKIPHFMDVIGQRIGFSASDLTKLNLLYNCTILDK
ncbi:Meprin A subunit beta [Larimichthys crocea]|uniref:Meprin A subunit beta n=1 Tax=Larimichthys crocea TaxID=215358 RepID=A0A6G0IR65_LARCR|nr:Meprin A subunit beta [Larimichthys crocea]